MKPLSWGQIDAALGLDVPTREEQEARIDQPKMVVERAEGGHGAGRRRGRTKVRRTIKTCRALRH